MLAFLLFMLSVALGSPWPEPSLPTALDPVPGDAAVVVGVERYFVVQDVPGATRNAEQWYRYLTLTRGMSPARVRLLRDGEATREAVLSALEQAADHAGPDGRVWFVFIGHGVPTPDGRDGVLVGVDAQNQPDRLYPRGIRRSEVVGALSARRSVVVLDTCFSGQSTGGPLLPGLQFLVPTWATGETGATILSAGSASEFAGPLPGGGRPAFSYLVLGALLGWADGNGDGEVTASEVTSYARDALQATVRGRTQTPEFSGPDQVLAGQVSARGPNIVEIVIGQASPPPTVDALRDDPDATQAFAALHRAQQVRIQAERQAAEQRELDQVRQHETEVAVRARQARAAQAYADLRPLLERGDPTARERAQAFLAEHQGASVGEGAERRTVPIPELDRVRAYLERGDLQARTHKVTAPLPPPYEPIPWALWRRTPSQFGRTTHDDPSSAWDVHLATWHLPSQLRSACDQHCPDLQESAEEIVGSTATYAAARLDRTFDRLAPRELGYIFTALVMEARDLWYRAAGDEQPLVLATDLEGLVGSVPGQGRAWVVRAALIELLDWTERREVPSKCVDKIRAHQQPLLLAYDALAPRLDGTDSAAAGELNKLLRRTHALARRATRCR